uniref:Polycystic kidney disease 2-like 1 protein n=1 Tax=Timema bartmani TaxID=61472 RepID=A0A7R9F9T2_9NEOP|nr:unnamed protein product [Timema bartmani]
MMSSQASTDPRWGPSREPRDVESPEYERHLSTEEHSPPETGWRQRLENLWVTRQMAEGTDNKTFEIQLSLKELIIYVIFLIVFNIVALGMMSITYYYYTKVLMGLFVESSFKDIKTMADFWNYVESPLIDGLFWDVWYNDQAITSKEDRNILYENRMLGIPRMRQVKVRNNSCTVHDEFRRTFSTCYDYFSSASEDTEPFGLGTGTAWTYSSPEKLDTSSYWGWLGTYGGGGFYEDFSIHSKETLEKIKALKENLWITRGTRAVFIDFTLYNANINLFCIIKLTVEFPPTGGATPSWDFLTLRLLSYQSKYDYFIFACEILFIFFIVFFTLEEVREIIHFKFRYIRSFWNVLDIIIITLSYACILFNIFQFVKLSDVLQGLLNQKTTFANFDHLGRLQVDYNNMEAVALFFAWVKIFKFISFNKTMSQLSNTLSRCAWDIAGFSIMFFIVFCAFAQLSYLLFGSQLERFSTFINAMFTLLRILLADFDYDAIERANRILGPLFFVTYIFFVFFVLLNMFLAIINDTYSEVKSEISSRKDFEVSDFLWRGVTNALHKFGYGHKLARSDGPRQDGKITFREIRDTLRKCNFSELEIEMFFAKYDIDPDQVVGEVETRKMLADIEGRKFDTESSIHPKSSPEVTQQEFTMLEGRVERMEESISTTIDKIETILAQLEKMAKGQYRDRP